MLDSVLRRGQTLDAAAARARGLAPADHGLAIAISGEVLRRIPDLDALIDGATRQRLPDDSKARMVLRLALAQKLGLQTPDHALVATALPLVDGGPRRLVHGVLGTLLRRGVPVNDAPRLPDEVEERWRAAWGDEAVAASLPARAIPTEAPDVLDLCAAPGGKTMQLAAAGHRVTSVDSSESRLGRLRENLKRTHLDAELVQADALAWNPDREFDAILLDAPCSATGTFRRHPEVLYRARPKIVADNAELQGQLLRRAAGWLKAGGTLVYSVCSLEPQEGEAVIERFLEERDEFRIEPSPLWGGLGGGAASAEADDAIKGFSSAAGAAGPPPTSPTRGEALNFLSTSKAGFVRILPGLLESEGGLDGFFIARLVRRG
jgi:16S rRNA (cytosine967-C5)-methyltransferase